MKTIGNYVFFYGGILSNFTKAHFKMEMFCEIHEFFCSEQAFMWLKAKYFRDEETAKLILAEKSDPKKVKMLGRQVRNYDDEQWAAVRRRFMEIAVLAKFKQNKPMADALCDKAYNGKTFVEASPIDTIWGIGLGLDTEDSVLVDETKWRGTNLLGQVVGSVRVQLLNPVTENSRFNKRLKHEHHNTRSHGRQ